MTILFCGSTGEQITLTNQINSSGEGTVWQTDRTGYLAKVYHFPDHERVEKLKVMVANPPKEPNSHLNHISFAWPKSLLKDSNGWVLGFLMPAITGSLELLNVYNSKRRMDLGLGVHWYFLHTVAQNIASIIQAIHAESYVIGDIKPQNILVNNRALPSIIDTDSFQVRHPHNGQVYRCLVGSDGFTPVELLGQDLSTVEQTEVHDCFRLAVIIYLLLFGEHPFKGQWTGKGDSPEPTELLRRGFWAYASNSLIQPGPHTIPLNVVHPEIQQCFLRCFNDGQTQPDLRPTAQEWKKALEVARNQLIACSSVDSHFYSQSYGRCYWCERASNLGVDIFPGRAIPIQMSVVNAPQSQSKIFAADNVSELLKEKGKEITVEGKVVTTNTHPDTNKYILNFGRRSPNSNYGYFRIVILSPNIQSLSEFIGIPLNSLTELVGRDIEVSGDIEIRQLKNRSYPQIVLTDPKLPTEKKESKPIVNTKRTRVSHQYPSTNKATAANKPLAKVKTHKTPNQPSNQVINLDQNYYKQGSDCVKLGDYHGAIQFYNQAIKLNPNNALFYRRRGNSFFYLKDYNMAIGDYQRALHLAPSDIKAKSNLTIALERLRNQNKGNL
ncbi:tetratricopeptide repeat protein [Iningainema tapete]|uniref:Tetratricopeptide repeat protein n=1 Tax=Iningainema tapete BLCC-T55 TaxID=2748662 RepID=A0A8J6XQW8_9CYAN|nr:tetratricopeptide repeat protein [Iningainema tapete]MBD2777611.1 tetratricopeptide repeat protein [Iningainema tapete BLCC-T55]